MHNIVTWRRTHLHACEAAQRRGEKGIGLDGREQELCGHRWERGGEGEGRETGGRREEGGK